MAAITITPSDKTGIYNDVIYTYTHTITSNSNPMAIEVEVFIDSILQNTIFINAFDLEILSTNFNYTFSINIKDTLIDYFENKAVFKPNILSFASSESSFLAKDTQIKVFRYEPNSSGVLTKNSTSTNSSMRTFFNSRVQNMNNYTASTNRKFLTSQTNLKFHRGGSKTIAIYADSDVNVIRQAGGVGNDISLTQNQINILNIEDYINSSTTQLMLQGGFLDAGDNLIQNTETVTIKIIDDLCNFAVLHYQNKFGQMDSFIFERFTKKLKIDNETFSNNEYLNEILNIENEYEYNLIHEGFTSLEFQSFQDVFASSVFYIEIDNIFKQVVIRPKNNISIIEENGMIDIELKFIESNEEITFIN